MIPVRVCPRLALHLRFMRRQQSLGKFFAMPRNAKPAPPQQSSLAEAWGKKRKPEKPVEKEPASPKPDDMQVDEPTESAANTDKKRSKSPSPSLKNSSPRPSKPKRRRVVESEEDEPRSSQSHKPSSRTSSPKLKRKTKANPAAASPPPATSEDPESAASAGEEDANDEGEEELSDMDDDAAQKNAEAALKLKNEVDVKSWKVGEPVPYAALAHAFSMIEATTKRLEKTHILTTFFLLVIQRSAKGDTNSLLQTVYLCINRLSPDYIGIELGIGESLLIKAISESTGRSLATVKADLKKEGDLGLVALNSKNSQKTLFKPKPLTLPFVFSKLKEIALSTGHSSQSKKVSIITKLLAACQDVEAKYIIRSLEGKLRIGNAERTVLVALAHAAVLAEKEQAGKKWSSEKLTGRLEEGTHIMKSVYSELPTYDLVIPALLEDGIDKLKEKCKLTPGVPLKPMLAKPTKAIGEVLDRFENKRFTCEYKYDGERAQVHKLEDGTVAVFSRNSEDMSKKYPDLVEQLPHCIKPTTKTFVLDAEAVAIEKATGKLMPFQELSRRKRKDVKIEDIQVRVCLFAFDLLYLNGEPLMQKSLGERRELLREHFQVVPGEFDFAKSSDGETTDEIQTFLEESVKDGCEGLMVKMLETDASYYEPSRRSVNWLKLKKDYLAGVGDSLDLVVVGGYYGKGKRTNVYGAFLLACYDADAEEYQTICKIGTGFSEEALQQHWDTLRPLEMEKLRGDLKAGGAKPDIWFEPKIVWEVLTADLSLSPVYTAAQGLVEERGISLRFPRFLRVRDDKSADDATGPEQVAEMYERQALAQSKGNKKGKGGDGDDFW
ncbi:ATP-dependent DNA ligase [Coniophora puteana RWD-64-598 SS2]|uniref:DNA ligase n=1 Tax=Coniophora puteana (strain RWD-64-598) TaxID=741705 RepID=A0A5M3N7B4_CONPW|nr:ATP-dependent DNA ligase [Coniophora puteana RWD-64-598 SS2]EIW86741.1 ATP-dependent DNA ligase [Coniophora puteana RWD-64-598 SS2]